MQIFNIVVGLLALAWEYPFPYLIPNTALHRSIAARLALYPVCVFFSAVIYQGTNAALYYLIGMGVYFWAYSEGEVRITPEINW